MVSCLSFVVKLKTGILTTKWTGLALHYSENFFITTKIPVSGGVFLTQAVFQNRINTKKNTHTSAVRCKKARAWLNTGRVPRECGWVGNTA